MKKMDRNRFIEEIGEEWIYLTVGEAVTACNFKLHTSKPANSTTRLPLLRNAHTPPYVVGKPHFVLEKKNWNLVSVNAAMAGTGIYQLSRKISKIYYKKFWDCNLRIEILLEQRVLPEEDDVILLAIVGIKVPMVPLQRPEEMQNPSQAWMHNSDE